MTPMERKIVILSLALSAIFLAGHLAGCNDKTPEKAEAPPQFVEMTPMEYAEKYFGYGFGDPLDWTATLDGLKLNGRFELHKGQAVIGVARTKGLMKTFDPSHAPVDLARIWTQLRLDPSTNVNYSPDEQSATELALSGTPSKMLIVLNDGWAEKVGQWEAWVVDLSIDHYALGEPTAEGKPVLRHWAFKQREASFFADDVLYTLTLRVPSVPEEPGATFDDLVPEFQKISQTFRVTEAEPEPRVGDNQIRIRRPTAAIEKEGSGNVELQDGKKGGQKGGQGSSGGGSNGGGWHED